MLQLQVFLLDLPHTRCKIWKDILGVSGEKRLILRRVRKELCQLEIVGCIQLNSNNTRHQAKGSVRSSWAARTRVTNKTFDVDDDESDNDETAPALTPDAPIGKCIGKQIKLEEKFQDVSGWRQPEITLSIIGEKDKRAERILKLRIFFGHDFSRNVREFVKTGDISFLVCTDGILEQQQLVVVVLCNRGQHCSSTDRSSRPGGEHEYSDRKYWERGPAGRTGVLQQTGGGGAQLHRCSGDAGPVVPGLRTGPPVCRAAAVRGVQCGPDQPRQIPQTSREQATPHHRTNQWYEKIKIINLSSLTSSLPVIPASLHCSEISPKKFHLTNHQNIQPAELNSSPKPTILHTWLKGVFKFKFYTTISLVSGFSAFD